MPIIDISPVGNSFLNEKPKSITPTYLIEYQDIGADGKSLKAYMIAVKLSESQNYQTVIGFDLPATKVKSVFKDHQKLVSETDKSIYKEVQFPWGRVLRTTNLIFRAKQ